MPKPNLVCKVCGKPYYLCPDGAQRAPWLRVVCSPECLEEWNKAISSTPTEEKPETKKKAVPSEKAE